MSRASRSDEDAERAKLGERLREARKYLGFTQEEIAGQLNIGRSALSEIESGVRKIGALELRTLSRLYGHPVSYFLGDEAIALELSEDLAHLARAASELSKGDKAELVRFADFLKARARAGESDDVDRPERD